MSTAQEELVNQLRFVVNRLREKCQRTNDNIEKVSGLVEVLLDQDILITFEALTNTNKSFTNGVTDSNEKIACLEVELAITQMVAIGMCKKIAQLRNGQEVE